MSAESNNEKLCDCNELQKKYINVLEVNNEQSRIIRDLRLENEGLRKNTNGRHVTSDPISGRTSHGKTSEVQSLIQINHAWKKDYETVQTKYYTVLEGEKQLEVKVSELEEKIKGLESRQKPLENEIARLAAILYAQNAMKPGEVQRMSEDVCHEMSQCDLLRTQMLVYKEDFERERLDRTRIHHEKEKLRQGLHDAEEIIKKLTTELDICKENERFISERLLNRPEDGYVNVIEQTNVGYLRHQVQIVVPPEHSPNSTSGGSRRRYEQSRRGILPRNPPPTSFFYGGDVEVDSC